VESDGVMVDRIYVKETEECSIMNEILNNFR